MTIHFDDKGKFYTEVISKKPIRSTIQTITHRLEGNIYVKSDPIRRQYLCEIG